MKSRGTCFAAALAVASSVVFAFGPSAVAGGREPQIPDLKVEKYTLPNGLEVILHEDHTTPVVGVNLWYKVGSKNEKPGRTGFAHLFEHLMFQGSQHHDKEYFGPIEKVGAQINGSTTEDRTNYYETLPSNALELALWLESDRMGFLLPALSLAKLDNQRDVVKNERRQRVDNVPGGQARERLGAELYPESHPYHHSVIGSMADLSAASLSDVSGFFRKYYAPNNASLVVAGDIDPAKTKELVKKYFGPLPAGEPVEKMRAMPVKLEAPKHIKTTDRVSLARTSLVWPTVERGHADEQALDVLAEVLGGLDKQHRLYRPLMYDKQLATMAAARHGCQQLAGTFTVMLSPRPGTSLDVLVEAAEAEIKRLKEEGPTEEEIAKAQTSTEAGLILGLQSATRKADFLNANNVESGDPLAYRDELKKLFAVTPADVKRVANQYLTANRIRLDVSPGPAAVRAPEVDRKAAADETTPAPVPTKDGFDRNVAPKLGANPDFKPPAIVRRKLSNGLPVLIAERHELPILTVNLVVKGGDTLAPAGSEGLAAMAADLMTEGTETRDALKLAAELSDIGASLNSGAGDESSNLSLTTLTKHADKGLELFADVLLHPSFPEKELDRVRKQKVAGLLRRNDNASAVAGVVFAKLLYTLEHPYGRTETAKSLAKLKRDDLVAFYKKLFVPNNSAIIVVGDVKPDEIAAKLETALKDWKPGEAVAGELPTPPANKPTAIYLVDKPGAAQSVISAGHVGVPRATPDYFALTVMNSSLGGQFSSRINLNLREDKGYTYGARSGFQFRQGPGPFTAGASVQTAVTKPALVELMKELTEVGSTRPLTDDELAFAKDRMIKGFPSRFETTFGLAGALADLVTFGLPDDYYASYQSKIEAVTKDDASRVAAKYVDPKSMLIVIVGDRATIEKDLKTLPYGQKIQILDNDGEPVKEGAAAPASAPAGKRRRPMD